MITERDIESTRKVLKELEHRYFIMVREMLYLQLPAPESGTDLWVDTEWWDARFSLHWESPNDQDSLDFRFEDLLSTREEFTTKCKQQQQEFLERQSLRESEKKAKKEKEAKQKLSDILQQYPHFRNSL